MIPSHFKIGGLRWQVNLMTVTLLSRSGAKGTILQKRPPPCNAAQPVGLVYLVAGQFHTTEDLLLAHCYQHRVARGHNLA